MGRVRRDEAKFLLLRLLAREEVRPRFWALGFGEGRFVEPLPATPAAVASVCAAER